MDRCFTNLVRMKPLWRWTVGNTTHQGIEILEESVFRAMKALGRDTFDWVITFNGLTAQNRSYIEGKIVQGRPIRLVEQTWSSCPIPDSSWSPIRVDGKVEVDGKKCGGTLWKVCPPRMRIETHEIVMDNDLVLLRKPPAIQEFLESEYHTLVLEEPIRFYGRYDHLFDQRDRLNSGLMGYPPGFDFGTEIFKNWEKHGKFRYLTQADEQGLLMYTMFQRPNIRLTKYEIKELLAKQAPEITGDESGLHFVQANRTVDGHRGWIRYQEMLINKIRML